VLVFQAQPRDEDGIVPCTILRVRDGTRQ